MSNEQGGVGAKLGSGEERVTAGRDDLWPEPSPSRTTDHDTVTLAFRLVPSSRTILRKSNPAIYFREPDYGSLKMLLLRNATVWLTVARSADVDDDDAVI